jgi:hypothetical protein
MRPCTLWPDLPWTLILLSVPLWQPGPTQASTTHRHQLYWKAASIPYFSPCLGYSSYSQTPVSSPPALVYSLQTVVRQVTPSRPNALRGVASVLLWLPRRPMPKADADVQATTSGAQQPALTDTTLRRVWEEREKGRRGMRSGNPPETASRAPTRGTTAPWDECPCSTFHFFGLGKLL